MYVFGGAIPETSTKKRQHSRLFQVRQVLFCLIPLCSVCSCALFRLLLLFFICSVLCAFVLFLRCHFLGYIYKLSIINEFANKKKLPLGEEVVGAFVARSLICQNNFIVELITRSKTHHQVSWLYSGLVQLS